MINLLFSKTLGKRFGSRNFLFFFFSIQSHLTLSIDRINLGSSQSLPRSSLLPVCTLQQSGRQAPTEDLCQQFFPRIYSRKKSSWKTTKLQADKPSYQCGFITRFIVCLETRTHCAKKSIFCPTNNHAVNLNFRA